MRATELQEVVEVRLLCASGAARRRREDSKLSLSEVADVCGVDTSTVWRWETGLRRPRGPAALRYARILSLLNEEPSNVA